MTPLEIKAVEMAQECVMPWGNYRDKCLDDIPSKYLRWLATDCRDAIISHHADVLWNWREEMDCHVF